MFCDPETTKQAIGLAWIYFDYSNQLAQTYSQILGSIIKQFVSSVSLEIGKPLLVEIMDFQRKFKGKIPKITDYLDLLSDIVTCLNGAIVLIDALDESPEKDSNQVLREWLISCLLNMDVQLLVTSRDMPVIKGLFEDCPGSSFAIVPVVPDPLDIKSYIKWEIFDKTHGTPKKLRKLLEQEPILLEEITNVVSEKYSEMWGTFST